METGENSVVNLSETSSSSLSNNNSIELNGLPETDGTLTNGYINKEIGSSISTESTNHTEIPKPNVFELIGGNKNCDSESIDCKAKTSLNNNDLAIGFVDDDDETNGEDGATNFNHCSSDEATKGHDIDIGQYGF